eukprot:COSAG05_NODE_1877_length_3912_cov_18.999738_1_plen_27_part_10
MILVTAVINNPTTGDDLYVMAVDAAFS